MLCTRGSWDVVVLCALPMSYKSFGSHPWPLGSTERTEAFCLVSLVSLDVFDVGFFGLIVAVRYFFKWIQMW